MSNIIAKAKKGMLIATELSEDSVGSSSSGLSFRADLFIEELVKGDNAYLFPFGSYAKGFTPSDDYDSPSVLPQTETNLVYDENGVYIGAGTANLWNDKTILHGFIGDGTISKIWATPAGEEEGVICKKTALSDTFSTLNASNEITYSSGIYTISSYIRFADGGIPQPPAGFELAQGTGGGTITNTLIRQMPPVIPVSTQWNRVIRTADYTGSSTNMIPNIEWQDSASSDAEYRFYGMQLEQKPFATPFVSTSRSSSILTYNFNSSISLDWSQPWTIMYYKKPCGTDNDLTGYSVESLGEDNNTVGGGYLWFGKPSGSNTLALRNGSLVSGTNSYNWEDFQYNWQLNVIRYNGSDTIKYDVFGLGDHKSFSSTLTISSANYFVNQDGYDFQLGGFGLAHQPEAYYRALTIYKSYWSDSDLTNYYNTKLKVYASDGSIHASLLLEEDL